MKHTFTFLALVACCAASAPALAQRGLSQPDLAAPAIPNRPAAQNAAPQPPAQPPVHEPAPLHQSNAPACGAEASCGCESGCSTCGSGGGLGDLLSCDCCLGDAWTLQSYLTPCCDSPTYGGWLSMGYYNHNERLSFDRSDSLAFRDFPHHLNFDQVWLYVEKVANSDGCNADYGYRFDIMYGTDAQFAQAYGNPGALDAPNRGSWDASLDHGPYGWAMPQAYGQIGWNDWSIKIGRFWTPVGYEVVPATGNFFYSHSLAFFNSEPVTHTGVLGEYRASDCMTYHVGWALGWDTGFDQQDGGSIFHGGFIRKLNDDVTFTYMTTIGNFGWRSGGEFGYSQHFVLVNDLSPCLKWVLASDFVHTEGTLADDDFNNEDYGLTNYLIYEINDCWSAGGRFEWWKSNSVTGLSDSFQELTGGVNYRANANLVIRPEVRYDFTNEGAGTGDDYNQWFFGVDAVFTF
ncbi:MAG: outer membrane beta-barrel protein [Pirellulales bacterium]